MRRAILQYQPHLRPQVRHSYSTFRPSPAPPRLPKEDQALFEKLQEQSTGAFSTPRTPSPVNQSPASQNTSSVATDTSQINASVNQSPQSEQILNATIKADGEGDELHPNMRRGAPPEFEGDTNPKTGEVGGPKNEPLRWGHGGDWSYNGRVTDF
ncbi:DUF1674-domain-containing protein [Pseudovirgaria hyperparasitica]|uniref:Succinate dehydrogenase assembly factor 4, mitochondrial n=1 Tax=Pseudovirgaria hyperparasitica TaxID=470096 RepID=A0A6A6WEZ8_9PEZI|nr:DUF1674-domain-containing protein [Pseudovirgaria hyperparasitica]KAF2760560.1 DUF1674-domain-containing protein [Pseudovirgaria hyperparasitica]